MPIYEYRCPSCSHQFEKMVRMDAPKPACPECGHDPVDKLISTSSFVLKGGGWYKDHYGLKGGGSSSGGSESSGGGGDS